MNIGQLLTDLARFFIFWIFAAFVATIAITVGVVSFICYASAFMRRFRRFVELTEWQSSRLAALDQTDRRPDVRFPGPPPASGPRTIPDDLRGTRAANHQAQKHPDRWI